ncbi:MAG: UDP-N-acetylmuramoyl-L-alanine--D-glutamate ligase [Candidatus Gracilibacteria bacterium]
MNLEPTCFTFRSYSFEPQKKRVRFLYEIEFKGKKPLKFTETILLPSVPKAVPKELLYKVLESVHLMLGISYYKLYCPKKVTLPYALTEEQAIFWTTVYKKGLGEFAYRNKLDPRKFAKFPFKRGAGQTGAARLRRVAVDFERKDRGLLGIGGGKDSIVAGELMKKAGKVFDAFLVETERPSFVAVNVIKTMKVGSLTLERRLDPKIFEEHEGAYNGHIPISGVFAFLGLLAAVLYDYRYVIVGNEHSSNFGNVRYKGVEINHQWSKSAEFEGLLQNYTRKFLTPDVTYFSLLRPFYEIRITEMFTHYPQYFGVFTSCNRNFKIHETRLRPGWCCECAKCVFVFTMLSAFLDKKTLVKIFGKDLYADAALKPMFKDLMGEGKMKPFDCVGTFEEMRVAYQNVHVHKIDLGNVFKTVQAPTVPVPFRLLGMNTVLILGYGKEGKATHEFLKARYPELKVGIADQSTDVNYLKKQEEFDFVIKTPGIPKNKVTRPYITATNLFFAERKNFTVGVTGSKGKSTTASLIYHLLRAGGKKARLMGNIGKPMLSSLLEKEEADRETRLRRGDISVLELSSYQLDDIEYSPDIAVVTNLFPEHMTYHDGLENYYHAKSRIVSFAKSGDFFVYNPHLAQLKQWQTRAKKIPFTTKLPLRDSEIPLLGEHNRDNVRAAVTVARLLGVSDTAIKKGILTFKALPHRLEEVGTFKKIHFYDDAISTTPESTIMALKALKKVDTIFLGGEDRGYKFDELEKMLRKMKVRNIVLFPETGARMLKSRAGFTVLETRSMESAVRFAYKNTAPGKICLLSCASPSYSLWTNFEEKGEQFQKLVRSLT